MRNTSWLVSLGALVLLSVRPALGLERPLAALVPSDTAVYRELNLDALLGRTPETADLRQAFRSMQTPKILWNLVAQDPDVEFPRELWQAIDITRAFSEAVGPRIGIAVWTPDLTALARLAAGGDQLPVDPDAAMALLPSALVVADVRDGRKLDDLVAEVAELADLPMTVGEGYQGAKVTTFADVVALARGEDWMALGFPVGQTRAAADRAIGRPSGGSLSDDPSYQQVMSRLPEDTVLRGYVSAPALRQLVSAATSMLPGVRFPPPPADGVGWAVGARVDDKQGRKMATAYLTADLDIVPFALDAPMAVGTALLLPVFERARESARKVQCLSNIKSISVAAQMYCVDYDRFPSAERWTHELEEYIRNDQVLKCPKDTSDARSSYGMNRALSGKPESAMADPARVVLFYETARPGDSPSGGPGDIVAPPRHLGGNNYGFADGHAAWSARVPGFSLR